jgi:hypothetical protein
MKPGIQLKPQDVLVLLKLITWKEAKSWGYASLAKALFMSLSEVHSAIKRAQFAELYDPLTKRPIRANFSEFLLHGLRYAFPAQILKGTRGIPTAHAAFPLKGKIVSSDEDNYVWPSRLGKTKGKGIEPLYRSVPHSAMKDPNLYELLVLIDALRVGRIREKDLAKKILQERLASL